MNKYEQVNKLLTEEVDKKLDMRQVWQIMGTMISGGNMAGVVNDEGVSFLKKLGAKYKGKAFPKINSHQELIDVLSYMRNRNFLTDRGRAYLKQIKELHKRNVQRMNRFGF